MQGQLGMLSGGLPLGAGSLGSFGKLSTLPSLGPMGSLGRSLGNGNRNGEAPKFGGPCSSEGAAFCCHAVLRELLRFTAEFGHVADHILGASPCLCCSSSASRHRRACMNPGTPRHGVSQLMLSCIWAGVAHTRIPAHIALAST